MLKNLWVRIDGDKTEMPTASVLPVPSRNTVQHGTERGLTSGFGMSPGVSPDPMAVGRITFPDGYK